MSDIDLVLWTLSSEMEIAYSLAIKVWISHRTL